MKKHLPFLFVLLFSGILLFQIFSEKVLLADDLSVILSARNHNSFIKFLEIFLDSPWMSPRPISALLYAPSIYLVNYFGINFYFINHIFYLSSLVMIYILITKFYNNKIATLGVFLYSLLPFASFTTFSLIMMNSALATIFYCLSLLFILKIKKNSLERLFLCLSSLFFLLSVLSYEIFVPLILLNTYLIPTKKYSYKIVYIFITFSLILIYRNILAPNIFNNFLERTDHSVILDFPRHIYLIKEIIITFFIKLPIAIFRGIRAIIYYNWNDYILLIASIIFSYFLIFKTKYSFSLDNNSIPFFIGFLSSFIIFFISVENFSIYDFSSRILGATRLFLTLFILSLFVILIRQHLKYIKLLYFFILIVLSITTISSKNAWIYANQYNINLLQELKNHIPKNPKTNYIFITYDKNDKEDRLNLQRNDKHFIFSERILYNRMNSYYLKTKVNIDEELKIEYFFSKKKKYFPKNYYLFDYKTKTIEYITENP